MVQPTKGPWYAAKTGSHQGLIISEANGANVAVTYDKRDAALVAAAPELLASLDQCLTVIEFEAAASGKLKAMRSSGGYRDARAAIAKARGM